MSESEFFVFIYGRRIILVMSDLFSSATATLVAEVATLPICTLKTVYQTRGHETILGSFRSIYIPQGLKGFYMASPAAILAQVVSTSAKYTLYTRFKQDHEVDSMQGRIAAGITSGIVGSLFSHPIDVIKIHHQRGEKFIPNLRMVGVRLLYRGYGQGIAKNLVGSSLYFPIYDWCKGHTTNSFSAALVTAVGATLVTSPVDYIKTRRMAGENLCQGFNPATYYKGLSLNMARVIPHFILTMTLIESLKN